MTMPLAGLPGQGHPARQRMTDPSEEARIRQLTVTNGELRAELQRLRAQNALLLGRLREHAATRHVDHDHPPEQVS
ncbi:hypothetical protein [Streptosporangium sp. NPDC000396]|uniref:hypothetical protein n=1 Tax=Streptosporangium sp. NPDC000396 TaxID=3366185 RepID=UPI00368351F8